MVKKKKNNHGELLLSKVCFRKLAREWDAESVEPSALIWAKWGRKLAPRCETKKGWGEPLRRRQHLRKEPWGHFVILRYKTSPGDLQEKASLMLSSKFNRSSLYTVYFFFLNFISKLLPFERKSVKGSEMVIPPLSFVWNRKTIQTEVGFRQSGGKLETLERDTSSPQEEEK